VNEGWDQFSRGYWDFDRLFLAEPDEALAGSINDVHSVALYVFLFVERGAERPRLTLLQPSQRATSPSGKLLSCAIYQGWQDASNSAPNIQISSWFGAGAQVTTARHRRGMEWKPSTIARGFVDLTDDLVTRRPPPCRSQAVDGGRG